MKCFLSFHYNFSFQTCSILCGLPSKVSLNSVLPLRANSCTWAVRHTNVNETLPAEVGCWSDEAGCSEQLSCGAFQLDFPAPDPFPKGGNHEITPYKNKCSGMQCLQHHGCWSGKASCLRCIPFSRHHWPVPSDLGWTPWTPMLRTVSLVQGTEIKGCWNSFHGNCDGPGVAVVRHEGFQD